MSNLPKNPKPYIESKEKIKIPHISSTERRKVIQEMTELIRENKKIVAKYSSAKNEVIYE